MFRPGPQGGRVAPRGGEISLVLKCRIGIGVSEKPW